MTKKAKRDLIQIAIIWGVAFIAAIVTYAAYRIYTKPVVHQSITCPAGQFDAGGFCRNEPTGCAYGDSIPLDSPKCAPAPEYSPVDYGSEINVMEGK